MVDRPAAASASTTDREPAGDPERLIVTWADLERLVEDLAGQVRGEYDVMLVVTRGGLVPAGMLAYRLGIRDIIVAAVAFYDDAGRPRERPSFLQFPSDPLLRGRRVLVVDEVWDTGTTIQAVIDRVRLAGGRPTTAVLHYKPTRSRVPSEPDHYVVATEAWVVYPFKYGR
jgi:hypoxanthine phosphoribosyltransferase